MGTVAELPTVQLQGLVGLKGDCQLDMAPGQLIPGTLPPTMTLRCLTGKSMMSPESENSLGWAKATQEQGELLRKILTKFPHPSFYLSPAIPSPLLLSDCSPCSCLWFMSKKPEPLQPSSGNPSLMLAGDCKSRWV